MVLDYLRLQAGKTLDPQVVEAFLQLLQELDVCQTQKPMTDV